MLGPIRSDLEKLAGEETMHRHIADEVKRFSGGQSDAREQLQRRLAELDQQSAKQRDHLLAMDSQTAKAMGFYVKAKDLMDERQAVERRQNQWKAPALNLPDTATIKADAAAMLATLEEEFQDGALEQKRELIALYVKTIEADPNRQTVQISLYRALLSGEIGVTRHQ